MPAPGKSIMKWKLLQGSHGQAQSWAHLCTSTRISPQSLVKHMAPLCWEPCAGNIPWLPVPDCAVCMKGKGFSALDRNLWYLLSLTKMLLSSTVPCSDVWEAAVIHQGRSCLWDTTLSLFSQLLKTCFCFLKRVMKNNTSCQIKVM